MYFLNYTLHDALSRFLIIHMFFTNRMVPSKLKILNTLINFISASLIQVRLEDLKRHGVLGTGGFGRVVLVSYASKYYALKCMSKAYVIESNLQEHVKQEREVMMELQCPFIVNLLATFKDAHTIYMLMESIMGGELFTYLQVRCMELLQDSHVL